VNSRKIREFLPRLDPVQIELHNFSSLVNRVLRTRLARDELSAPDLFTAETPLGTYQGMTDQIVLSRTPGFFRTVLVPRGSSKPEWLSLRK
jgi:hypothetical protein